MSSTLTPSESTPLLVEGEETIAVNIINKNGPSQSCRFLTDIAWKRRGGMAKHVAKYTSSTSWERRRVELRGTQLVYYRVERGRANENDLSESNSFTDDSPSTALSPRGFLDLSTERVQVYVSHGHSGAPTPFGLSIKVIGNLGELTNSWKFCFDSNKTQIEWLIALTDTVIRFSVKNYNEHLLKEMDSGDPNNDTNNDNNSTMTETSNTDSATNTPRYFSPPPAVLRLQEKAYEAALTAHSKAVDAAVKVQKNTVNFAKGFGSGDFNKATGKEKASLWRVEPYSAFSQDLDSDERSYNDDDTIEDEECAAPTNTSQSIAKSIEKLASWNWHIPENRLFNAAVILNACAVCSTQGEVGSIKFGIFLIVVNFAVFSLCATKEPSWQSVLQLLERQEMAQQISTSGRVNEESKRYVEKNTSTQEHGYVPVAGTTTVKLDLPTDVPIVKDEVFTGFCAVPGNTLQVRSYGYATTGQKIASPGELYELVNQDIFESPSRYPDMASRVKLPGSSFDGDEAEGSKSKPKTWKCPDTFVVSIAIPTDPPEFGRASSDGGGYTLTMYFKMKKETRDILRRVTAEGYDSSMEQVDDPQKSQVNAVRLLEEWCRKAPTDPEFQARFKVVPNAQNLKEIGMPSWISRYNGKPFLIKRAGHTGFIYDHPELSCMEFDISLHPFPYLAKQAVCFMKDTFFKKVLVTFGFVIEGRSDDEVGVRACVC